MALFRSPAKTSSDMEATKSPSKTQTISKVRESIDKIENVETDQETPASSKNSGVSMPRKVIINRQAQAKAVLQKAKKNMDKSGNIKTIIKRTVINCIDELYELIKSSEEEIERLKRGHKLKSASCTKTLAKDGKNGIETASPEQKAIEDQGSLAEAMEKLTLKLESHERTLEDYKKQTKSHADKLKMMQSTGEKLINKIEDAPEPKLEMKKQRRNLSKR
ncbi:hypothetical protein O0L34_g10040 [Tuta absoluta]|nr:hypothetical protein O0L34_g10040 [Tuta absoluta]